MAELSSASTATNSIVAPPSIYKVSTNSTTLRADIVSHTANNERLVGIFGSFTDLMAKKTLILFCEIFATYAHIGLYDPYADYFDNTADLLKAKGDLKIHVDSKDLRDRFYQTQKSFNERDQARGAICGVGEELTKTYYLLSIVRERNMEQTIQNNMHLLEMQQWEKTKLLSNGRQIEKFTTRGTVVTTNENDRFGLLEISVVAMDVIMWMWVIVGRQISVNLSITESQSGEEWTGTAPFS